MLIMVATRCMTKATPPTTATPKRTSLRYGMNSVLSLFLLYFIVLISSLMEAEMFIKD